MGRGPGHTMVQQPSGSINGSLDLSMFAHILLRHLLIMVQGLQAASTVAVHRLPTIQAMPLQSTGDPGQGAQQICAQPPHKAILGGLRGQGLDDHDGLTTTPYGLGTSRQDHQLGRRLVGQQESRQSTITPWQAKVLQLQPAHLLATLTAFPQVPNGPSPAELPAAALLDKQQPP
ncbi:hypothetical protein COCOBI_19-2030 [Coccomyxa sp. Obi]|nr:hypothetical protein COCOBI_19-2030 [Coccomyxa sp. Obi]